MTIKPLDVFTSDEAADKVNQVKIPPDTGYDIVTVSAGSTEVKTDPWWMFAGLAGIILIPIAICIMIIVIIVLIRCYRKRFVIDNSYLRGVRVACCALPVACCVLRVACCDVVFLCLHSSVGSISNFHILSQAPQASGLH